MEWAVGCLYSILYICEEIKIVNFKKGSRDPEKVTRQGEARGGQKRSKRDKNISLKSYGC